jgi:hypothetical protein
MIAACGCLIKTFNICKTDTHPRLDNEVTSLGNTSDVLKKLPG